MVQEAQHRVWPGANGHCRAGMRSREPSIIRPIGPEWFQVEAISPVVRALEVRLWLANRRFMDSLKPSCCAGLRT